jgi:hypothetical protein
MKRVVKKKKMKNKKAAIEMSFQFIFSVILIAVVLFVGFYVIKIFLDRAEQVKFNDFVSRLKGDEGVWGVWTQDEASQVFSGSVNKAIKYVCFARPGCTDPSIPELRGFCTNITQRYSGNYNFFFYPLGVAEKYHAKSAFEVYCNDQGEPLKNCVDVSEPTCIKAMNIDGAWKIRMRLVKQNSTSLVEIAQP